MSILSHLLQGLGYKESLPAFVLLIQLLLMHRVFTAQSDRPSIAQGTRVLVGALLFTLVYGTAGFFLLDGQYSVNFDFSGALVQTGAMFFTADNAGLQPKTQFGRFFASSIYLVGACTLSYALLMLLRPMLSRNPALFAERQRAREIVEQHGQSTLARLMLLDDKAYYFSPSGRSVIAYVPKGRGAVALGEPIGNDVYLRESQVAVIYTPSGQISAFANVVSAYQLDQAAIDLMRRRTEVENGTMEFLFVSIIQHLQQLGYAGFDLGLSALSGGIRSEGVMLALMIGP